MKKYVFQRTSSCFTPFQPPLLSAPFITSALSSVSIFFLLLAANVSTSNCPSCPNYFGRDDLKILPTTFTLKAAGLNTTDELSIYVWDNLAVLVCISSSRDSLTRLGCHLRRETYPNIFFFFSEKVPQQLQHEWRDMREFSLFFLFCLWPSLVSSHHTHFARLYFQWQLKPWRDIFSIFYFCEGASERETEPESAMPEKHESCQHFSEKGPHVWEGGNAWERTCKETH